MLRRGIGNQKLTRQPFIDGQFNNPLQIGAPCPRDLPQAHGRLPRHRKGHIRACIFKPALRLRQKMPNIPLSHIELTAFPLAARMASPFDDV